MATLLELLRSKGGDPALLYPGPSHRFNLAQPAPHPIGCLCTGCLRADEVRGIDHGVTRVNVTTRTTA